MKYSSNFNRDFNFYFKMRKLFNFDGTINYYDKKGNNAILYNKNGLDAKQCFWYFDTQGIIKPTKHPLLLYSLLKSKGSTNFHIKMYAEDLASGLFPLIELRAMCIKYKTPFWFRESIQKQKKTFY